MAKVEIRLKENIENKPNHGLLVSDLDFFINGIKINDLYAFHLSFANGEINAGECSFLVDDIHVDAEILPELTAIAKNKDDSYE